MYRIISLAILLAASLQGFPQLFSEDFGTTFSTTYLGGPNWSTCRSTSSNSSTGPCAGTGDYGVYLYNNQYLTTGSIFIPGTGYCLQFNYSFNSGSGFPEVQVGSGGAFCFSAGTNYVTLGALTQTATCDAESYSLDAYAGQTIFIRFQAGSSFSSFYIDDVVVTNSGCSGGGGGGTTCLLDGDFGTAFGSLNTTNWPFGCSGGTASGFNTSVGSCASTSDYGYSLSGFSSYITTAELAIPSTGYTLDFEYAFNNSFGFPSVEIRSGGTCGTSLQQTVNLTNTSGVCTPETVNLDAYAGQSIFIRFRANTGSAIFYLDEVKVCGPTASPAPKFKWADNFNDNDLVLDYTGNDGDEDCASCGPWVLGGGASLNLVPAGGWNGNTNKTEAFPDNMPNVYYVRLDRNEWIESPTLDLSQFESFKISFYAKSSSPGTGGGDTWSFSDRLRLQIWDGSAWQTVQSLRDDLGSSWSGPDDYISAALPFNYYCFSAYKSTSSPGNHYYSASPNVNTAWFHSGFKFRVLFEGGFSGAPFAWVDDFTFRADADGYSTMIPCGVSFWNEPAATAYGQDPGTTGNNNAEKGVELELDNSINIPPDWANEADDGDTVSQVFGVNESERIVFCAISEQEINFGFGKVHWYAPNIGWQTSSMSIDNNYTGPGWKYYAVEYVSCDLISSTIAQPTTDFQYYFSFEYGIEFMPVFYQLNTSGIEYGGGVTSALETFNAPDIISTDNCGALPAQAILLSGSRDSRRSYLSWTVETPLHEGDFQVLRSADGLNFERVSSVPWTGNQEDSYSFADQPPGDGGYWYQVTHFDRNGYRTDSEVLFLAENDGDPVISLFPNPSKANGTAQLRWGHLAVDQIELLDLQGRMLFQKKVGDNVAGQMDLYCPPAGIYLLRITSGGNQKVLKWIISGN